MQWSLLAKQCDHAESIAPTRDYLSGLHTVARAMCSECSQYRPTLSDALRLFNTLCVTEDMTTPPSYHSRACQDALQSNQPFRFLRTQQRFPQDQEDEWSLLLVVPRIGLHA